MIKKLLFLFFLFPILSWSQNDTLFKGKIVSESNYLEDIHIINVSKKIGVLSGRGGYFKIFATENDTLMFSAVHLKGYQRVVTLQDFKKELVFIPMEIFENQLAGVTLTKYKNINAESLGIVPKGQRTYTPAERKLVTAGDFKWYSPLLIPVGGMSVDGLVNAISGRTAMLRKELVIEGKEMLQEKTTSIFTKEYMMNTLHIPEDYVEGFLFYVVEDARFTTEMKRDNKTMATFILSQLADEYLKLKAVQENEVNDEKK